MMTNNQTKERVRNKLAKGTKTSNEQICDLLRATDEALDMIRPMIVHGKEATDEYNDFPSDTNRVIMEMARNNVLLAANKIAVCLSEKYDGLSKRAKDIFTFREFSEIVQERLTTLLHNNQ